jgi:hypothetical protein
MVRVYPNLPWLPVLHRGGLCRAFPGGIPQPILFSGADHRFGFDGDRGIRFEAKEPEDALYAAELFKNPIEPTPEGIDA